MNAYKTAGAHLAQVLRETTSPDDIEAAVSVLNALASDDLAALTARMTVDAAGNPVVITDEQQRAQRVWSNARQLQEDAEWLVRHVLERVAADVDVPMPEPPCYVHDEGCWDISGSEAEPCTCGDAR